jgi:Phage integrase family
VVAVKAWSHDWMSELAPSAVIYEEELPNRDDGLPRFVPEFVMAQLENDANLAQLPSLTARHLVVVMIETGLRIGDACTLEFSSLIDDSAGGPCLRFHNLKVRADQLVPLSAKAAKAIKAQQDHVRHCWPAGTPWLIPWPTRSSHNMGTARRPSRWGQPAPGSPSGDPLDRVPRALRGGRSTSGPRTRCRWSDRPGGVWGPWIRNTSMLKNHRA